MASRHRPRRGHPGPDVLETGGQGEYHPQGGARDPREFFMESGDLQSREFGVPEADLPGGKGHVVNPQTHPERPGGVPERPADYHKYHGVPSDDGQYDTPDGEVGESGRPGPVPELHDAVPVYIVDGGGNEKKIRKLITEGPVALPTGTTDPFRLADRDPDRVKFWICNETSATGDEQTGPGVRIGDWETTADNRGLLIPAATIKDFIAQDAIFVTNQSGSTVTISWGYETEVQAAGA